METHLLIDGKNTVYRSLFACKTRELEKVHPFVVWLRLANTWMNQFNPTHVHVFWDCPREEVWRKKVLNEYKDSRDNNTNIDDNVRETLYRIINTARGILPYMGVRQYRMPKQECDDLIYSACKMLTPPKSMKRQLIVVSSDKDFAQLQYHMSHVKCFDPIKQEYCDDPEVDPVIKKALIGDKSDNIQGYRGIGEVKGSKLAKDFKLLNEFLSTADTQIYKRNLALIDMSLNPYRVSNILYVQEMLSTQIEFDQSAIKSKIMEYKVKGMMNEFSRLVTPFKTLVPAESND